MSLRLHLDDCAYSRRLRQLLREAGHDVETPADIVRAIANLERSVPKIAGGFWVLNLYRW